MVSVAIVHDKLTNMIRRAAVPRTRGVWQTPCHPPHATITFHLERSFFGFPLKARYADSNIILDGVDAKLLNRDPHAQLPDAAVEPSSAELGASEPATEEPALPAAPERPPDMMYVGKLGRPSPVDQYGTIIRKTCRPFGVAPEQWNIS